MAGVPVLPSLPTWPDVSWEYADGRYSLSEEDVDKVLEYLENGIPLYRFGIDLYQEQLEMILSAILEL